MANLRLVIKELEQERNLLSVHLESNSRTLSILNGTSNRARKMISAAGRARIAAAQRARWAKIRTKKPKIVSIGAHKSRTMSPAARKRIIAAQKARWAKWRKAQRTE